MSQDEQIESFCRGIPKIELHCHLYGTIRKSTFEVLNKEAGCPLSSTEIDEFYTRGSKPVGVLRIFRALDSDLIRKPEHLERITGEYLEDIAQHNVQYSEFFWNPTGTVRISHIPFVEAQRAILSAMEKSTVDSRLILSIDREQSAEEAVDMVRWMIQHRSENVIGIGIDYREELGPPEKFEKAYRLAKEAGFRATAHAGEFGCSPKNIRAAIDLLAVDRVDHGYTVIEDQELTERCIRDNIIFCVVPTNSYYLRTLPPEEWSRKHPIREMVRLGIRLFPNTDDPAFHHVTPTGAWAMMVKYFNCGVNDLRHFVINSIDASWLPESRKEKLRKEWPVYFDNTGLSCLESSIRG